MRGCWGANAVPDRTVVRAAGGVVWRPSGDGVEGDGVEVCLVHRPRYDDWSLPKGKLDPGEPALLAAVREVAEEADVRAVPQVRLPSARYVSDGRPKVVDYWSLRAVGAGGFQPDTEVDLLRWLPVDEAVRLVSYPHDATVLRSFAALPRVTVTLALLRHASAGRRATWSGPDTARPLDDVGRAQALDLARLVPLIQPVRLLSASARRCVQTLDPAAERLDLPIEVDGVFDEPVPGQLRTECVLAAASRLVELAVAGEPVAVCSQGRVIPGVLALLAGSADAGDVPGADVGDVIGPDAGAATLPVPHGFATPKGGGWLLAFAADRLVAADPW
ncbi:NUDIX hydrolase [Micromonospora sonneratiae]|uniref:NUDIX domain-containing protein n=1 Tax=Micromonospora sonneratiae TaxID=1184706 RepID=A0ABW3YCH8_9ACTN